MRRNFFGGNNYLQEAKRDLIIVLHVYLLSNAIIFHHHYKPFLSLLISLSLSQFLLPLALLLVENFIIFCCQSNFTSRYNQLMSLLGSTTERERERERRKEGRERESNYFLLIPRSTSLISFLSYPFSPIIIWYNFINQSLYSWSRDRKN